jgi:hypothetical protein
VVLPRSRECAGQLGAAGDAGTRCSRRRGNLGRTVVPQDPGPEDGRRGSRVRSASGPLPRRSPAARRTADAAVVSEAGGAGSAAASSARRSRHPAHDRSVGVLRSRSGVSGRPGAQPPAAGREVDRLARGVLGGRPESQVQLLGVVVVHPLRAPLGPPAGRRRRWSARAARRRCGPAWATSRGSRVTEPSGRSRRRARLQVGSRGVEGAARVGRAAGDRDLPGVPEIFPARPLNTASLARKCGTRPLSYTRRAQASGSSTETWLATSSTGPVRGSRSPSR